jgi:hypothetical protein
MPLFPAGATTPPLSWSSTTPTPCAPRPEVDAAARDAAVRAAPVQYVARWLLIPHTRSPGSEVDALTIRLSQPTELRAHTRYWQRCNCNQSAAYPPIQVNTQAAHDHSPYRRWDRTRKIRGTWTAAAYLEGNLGDDGSDARSSSCLLPNSGTADGTQRITPTSLLPDRRNIRFRRFPRDISLRVRTFHTGASKPRPTQKLVLLLRTRCERSAAVRIRGIDHAAGIGSNGHRA